MQEKTMWYAVQEERTDEWRGGIEGRGCDGEDFQDISVLSIQRMLEQAYLLGKVER